ncbi:MAG: hypothetical protein AAGF45_07165 [Pseudomonadota bacterium]
MSRAHPSLRGVTAALWLGIAATSAMTIAIAINVATPHRALATEGGTSGQDRPLADERFQIEAVAEGFLRLDRRTGTVEFCVSSVPRYVCKEVVASPRQARTSEAPPAALIAENERLRAEAAELRRKLSMIAALAGGEGGPPAPQPAPAETAQDTVADVRREIDRAVDVTDYTIRRFRDLFRSLEEPTSSD